MGTEQQKRQFLPALARARSWRRSASASRKSAPTPPTCRRRRVPSEDGTHFILNGEKKFATNAALAGMMTVMANTPVTDNGTTREKVTAFLVTPDLPGFEIVKPNRSKCGIRGTWQAVLRFNDMGPRRPRPRAAGQGAEGRAGRPELRPLHPQCRLRRRRKLALEMAIQRANTREQFGRPIGQFHMVRRRSPAWPRPPSPWSR